MRKVGHIMTGFALLLTFMYSSGIGISRCACSGNTALYSFWSDYCCPGEDCMMVTVVQLTDAYNIAHNDMPAPMLMPAVALCSMPCIVAPEPERVFLPAFDSDAPPGLQASMGMVMRV